MEHVIDDVKFEAVFNPYYNGGYLIWRYKGIDYDVDGTFGPADDGYWEFHTSNWNGTGPFGPADVAWVKEACCRASKDPIFIPDWIEAEIQWIKKIRDQHEKEAKACTSQIDKLREEHRIIIIQNICGTVES